MTERWRLAAALCLAGALGTAHAAVTEVDNPQRYDVGPSPGTSLLQALNAASPVSGSGGRVFHGHTAWRVDWQFRYRTLAGGLCAIASVDTRLTVTTTLPQLRSSTPEVAAAFARYLPTLVAHEDGHRRIGQRAAQEADAAIASLAPMASCDALGAEANRVGMAAVQRSNRADADYDAATRHGCTQNACLAP